MRSNPPVWTKISDNLGGSNSKNYQAIAQSPADVNVFYGARSDNMLFRSDNVNDPLPAWTDLTPKLPATGWIDDVMCHPTDPEIVYLIQGDKVYRSSDKGNHWDNITGSIPSGTGLNCFVYEKYSDEGIYVGTRTGVFYKNANLPDWIPFDGGLPVANVTELEIYYGQNASRIRAATYGRGLWESPLYTDPTLAPLAHFQANKTRVETNQTVRLEDLSANGPDSWTWTIAPGTFNYVNGTDANAQYPEIEFTSGGTYSVTLQVSNANGSDQKTIESYIQVISGIIPPNCTPATLYTGSWGMGIYQVELNNINQSSGNPQTDNPNPPVGYIDFSDDQWTILEAGESYSGTVTLGNTNNQFWGVYIDYNNNGSFTDAGEKVHASTSGQQGIQNFAFTAPLSPVLGTKLRMRVICEFGASVDPIPCSTLNYGQAEDYGIIFYHSPKLTTSVPGTITHGSAETGGNITDQGSSAILVRGVVWSILPDPTLDNNWGYTRDGSGTGTFNSQLSGLEPDQQYFVRAYASNSEGTAYGQNESFTTLDPTPVLNTLDVSQISYFSAQSGGEIIADGGLSIQTRGVVWDTLPNPALSRHLGFSQDGSGGGTYTSAIDQLVPDKHYYVRAYARNSHSVAYGSQKEFNTLPPDPNQSSHLVFSNVTTDQMDVSWTNGTGAQRIVLINTVNSFSTPVDGTDPAANPVYGGGEQVVYNGAQNTVTVSNLEPQTQYFFHVFDYDGSGSGTIYNTGPGVHNPAWKTTYCLPAYLNGDVGTHIKNFTLNTIDNDSGASSYSDYTDITTNLLPGVTYDLSVLMSYNSEKLSVWVDLDDDVEFEASEKLVDDFPCPADIVSTTQITLPVDAPLGSHLMRVRVSYYSGAEPCSTESWGEVEDYLVTIEDKISWTGANSEDWFEKSNWDVGVVPTSSYDVIIPNSTLLPLIGSGLEAFAKSIHFENGGDLQIEGTLHLAN